jgi:tetratricopeptide (TPR) repeat protein
LAPSFAEAFSFASPDLPEMLQVHPQYRLRRTLETVLSKVPAGSDEFVSEKYQDRLALIFSEWSGALLRAPRDTAALERVMASDFAGTSFRSARARLLSDRDSLRAWDISYSQESKVDRDRFLAEVREWLAAFSRLEVADFQLLEIHAGREVSSSRESIPVEATLRAELLGMGTGFHRQQRAAHFRLKCTLEPAGGVSVGALDILDEQRSEAALPVFVERTEEAFGASPSYRQQLLYGVDHWRSVLDGASGIDIYGHNGISVADIDGDGWDDVYICQPAGLPNRLFRNRRDGTFEDITETAGVGVLDNTSCALFADIDNDGRQDLIVVRATGPLLFLNRGEGRFQVQRGAFPFAQPPRGTFTGAAVADYDRDGWLDIYFCLYTYYRDTAQYRYPIPYFDAENGPPNFLFRNNRDGTFRDVTGESGLSAGNTRFSFCAAWGDYNHDLWPDLYVVNDFGRKNLYRNNGDGTFTDVAPETGAEDVGAGMGAAWFDFDQDGRDDLYVANMWTAAGIRLTAQENFQPDADSRTRALYRKHAMGNSLLRGLGERFEDLGASTRTNMGRWSWMSDSWDFNHDGHPDLYVTNGMISGASRDDLNSFFWRQIVARSPNTPRPSQEYEQGWLAINELIRSDRTWSGFERNVFYLNHGDGSFSDVSGVVGLDSIEDSRSFALGDFDRDGRPELLLKNRNGPQLRYFKNVLPELPAAISFRLTGRKSNRDAVGARIVLESAGGRQTRVVTAGSGFLAQHSKELFFGLGSGHSAISATIYWPSGLVQKLSDLAPNHRISVEEGLPPSESEPFRKFSGQSPSALVPRPSGDLSPQPAETWLLVPVLAPDFSLQGPTGQPVQPLSQRRGKPVLLHFWSESLADSWRHLEELEQIRPKWEQQGLQLVVLEVKTSEAPAEGARRGAGRTVSLPVFEASDEVVATYNLLYRQLFDRHRDMSLPLSFLVDPAGKIVKLYQGWVPAGRMEADAAHIPGSDLDRLRRALPFPGLAESYDFGRNYLSLGFVYYERGYFEQSELYFEQAQKDDPASAEALYGLGSVYLEQNKARQAKDCFERALALHAAYPGTQPNAWSNLGILAARAGDLNGAIELFERALKIDPDHAIALENLGSAYRQQKNWPEAERALKRALALIPEDTEANYSLGMVYAEQNDTARASQYLERALAARPDYPAALNNLGIVYLRAGRRAEAIERFKESIRVAPEYDQSYLNLARLYAIEGDRQKAKSVLEDLLKKHPDHAQALAELSQLER